MKKIAIIQDIGCCRECPHYSDLTERCLKLEVRVEPNDTPPPACPLEDQKDHIVLPDGTPDHVKGWLRETGFPTTQHMEGAMMAFAEFGWPSPNGPGTPLGGRPDKNPEHCRCETDYDEPDCGCGFGQCLKGLIY